MVASAHALFEAQVQKERAKVIEADVGIRLTTQYLRKQLVVLTHFQDTRPPMATNGILSFRDGLVQV